MLSSLLTSETCKNGPIYQNPMEKKWGLTVFALIEIIIGVVTLAAVSANLLLGNSAKPPEVTVFVLTTATISAALGFGILGGNLTSYRLLLFLSKTIILSKVLIFAHIISLNGALETTIPSSVKNLISIAYHSLLIFYFTRPPIRKVFE